MRSWRAATLALLIATALVAACGGDEPPGGVSETDLTQDAAFWTSLDDELQRELAGICQSEQVKAAGSPAEVNVVQDFDTDDYVALINDYYEEDAGSGDIETACDQAKVELASQNFDELVPSLGGGG